jgi:hypothetical protein
MLARVAKEREGHRASRRKCKCVLLLLVCEWLVAQNRPRGKEERTIWAEPQNGTAFRYNNNKTTPLFDTPVAQLVSTWYLCDSIHQLISSIPMESNAEVASSILAWSNTGLFWTFFARQMFLKPPKFDTQFSASVLKIL